MQSNRFGSMNAQFRYFSEHYDVVSQHHLVGRRKLYIASKDVPCCRYCGKAGSDTTFRKKAHAFPEFIGNKILIANDECDRCNERFSTTLEDHFAKFLMPLLAVAQIRGKKGVPTIKSRSGKSRFEVNTSDWIMISHQDDTMYDIDNNKKNGFTFNPERQPYIPMAVYKCLTKMAISMAPEEILPFFRSAINWISADDHAGDLPPMTPLICLETFTPGPRPYRAVCSILFTRKQDSDLVPYSIFVIAFGNSIFQIIVPSPERDFRLHQKEISFVPFPEPLGDDYPYGPSVCQPLDLTSEKIRSDEYLAFQYHTELRTRD